MRVFIGTDHAGLDLKAHLLQALADAGHDPVDCGAFTYDAQDDYPPFCIEVGERVVTEPGSLGIVIGGSGNGEQIAANKVPGVRAALVWNRDTAELARQHNDANVVAVGGRQHSVDEATELVLLFLATPFSDDPRHVRRIGLISDYERDRHRPAGGLPTGAAGDLPAS
jgi:ribose 5-phosphate isomerase B